MHQITIAYASQVGFEVLTVTHRTTGHYDITQYENELLWVNEVVPASTENPDGHGWRFGIRPESVISITIEPLADENEIAQPEPRPVVDPLRSLGTAFFTKDSA